jgi:Family of unknown function (DUF6504)
MARRYVENVEVVAVCETTGDPVSFRWRGYRYDVHEVLSTWHERRAWWTSPSALAVHGLVTQPGPVVSRDPGGPPRAAPAAEREVWRVEAAPAGGSSSRGGSGSCGVYDLCREVAGDLDQTPWRLLRVVD